MIEKKRSLRKANKQFTFSCFPGGMFMDIASSIYKDYTSYDGKSYATGLVRPKTTALFFDKIWYPSDLPEFEKIPKSIKYIERAPSRIRSKAKKYIYDTSRLLFEQKLAQEGDLLEDYYKKISSLENDELEDCTTSVISNSTGKKGNIDLRVKSHELVQSKIEKILGEPISFMPFMLRNKATNFDGLNLFDIIPKDGYFSSYYRNAGIRAATIRIRTIDHINIIPIYYDYTDYEKYLLNNGISFFMLPEEADRMAKKKAFTKETSAYDVIEACIDSIPMIVEENLTWRQVEEIRKDKTSIKKISRFLCWANKDFTGKSRSEIADILHVELEDYKFALKKHGISTSIGGFTTLLSGSATLLSALSVTPIYLTPACLSVTAGLLAFSTSKAIEILECNRNPIAFIYDVTKKANK